MLNAKSEYTGQKASYWHNYILKKSNHNDYISTVIYSISGIFHYVYGYKWFRILINLVSNGANKAMLDQEADNTETSNQVDISVTTSSKEQGKVKKPNQGLKGPLDIYENWHNKQLNDANSMVFVEFENLSFCHMLGPVCSQNRNVFRYSWKESLWIIQWSCF